MKKLLLILFAFALSGSLAWGQTLSVGDIAIIGINTDNADAFGFVALVDIPANTIINFTDNGVLADGSLRTGEGTLSWSSSSIVTKGTVVTWENPNWSIGSSTGSNPAFSGSGDQSIVYTGTSSSPTYIYALNIANSGWITSGTASSNTSYLPTGLTNGTNAIEVGSSDNGYYSGTTTGSAATLLGLISNQSNWTTNNSRIATSNWPSSFTITSSSGPDNPATFSASPSSTSQIDLSWTQNSNSDNVMVAYSTDGTFGTPTDGTSYSAGNSITGGGTVLYNGSAASYNHTSLTSGTHYYYKAWSVDGSANYSSGVTSDASTYKNEPSNHVTGFTATANGATTIDLSWTENDGTVAPDGYLIKANTGTITDPVDGTDPADDVDLTNGSGNVEVAYGTSSYSFTNCSPSTTYNFKIYPYTNSGSAINFKTDGTVPSASATTTEQEKLLLSVLCDPNDNYSTDRYIQIYNVGTSSVDLTGWSVVAVGNGADIFTWTLSGTIKPGETKTCGDDGNTRFTPDFASTDWSDNDGSWNGGSTDGAKLLKGSTIIDDASAFSIGFSNEVANRNSDIIVPTTTFTSSQWTTAGVTNADDSPSTPARHSCDRPVFTLTTGNWSTQTSGHGNGSNYTVDGDVTIDNNSTSPAKCNKLTINTGKSITIPIGKALTINGGLNNNSGSAAGLVVQSDATGNGSLIVDGTVTGSATVQRYIVHYTTETGAGNGWHEIGCPVSSYNVGSTDWDPTGTSSDLYYWNEVNNLWKNYKAASFDFTAGQGYLVAYITDLTHAFTGTLNNGDFPMTNLSYTPGQGNGWHLLGNPYTSALTWGDGNWNLGANVVTTAKVWNESTGNYADVTSGHVIPSTNGFFVQVTSGTNSLIIPAADRVHDATNNYKEASATNNKEKLIFKVTNDANSLSDESILGFKSAATEGFDNAFDSHKLFSMVEAAPSLWTVSKDQQFSTNYLPEMTKAYDVPLDFKPGVNTVYHLSVTGVSSFNNPNFVLEDTQTGKMMDLSKEKEYDFSAEKGDDMSRFVLHVNGVMAVPALNQKEAVQIFSYGKTIFLKGQESLNGKISVFNTLGQQVYEGQLNGMNKQTIRLDRKAGIYFVRVEDGSKVVTGKIFIQ